ncbi:MAG: glycoside hydrolase family 88 protein [Bacteroidales bacterium]|nr:glycoside hydrolase family 88 protein [Bacteroidales bacterium]
MKRIFLLILAASAIVACNRDPLRDFKNLPEGMDPVTIGNRVTEQFLSTVPERYSPVGFESEYGHGQYVHYSVTSLWTNSLEFARLTGNESLEKRLIDTFEPFFGEKQGLRNRDNHVDHSIFGSVPLEIYILNGDKRCLELGLKYADHQWAEPDSTELGGAESPIYKAQMKYWEEGYTPQTRLWIDDMYMINLLQTQAYRATGDLKYMERAAKEMVLYLDNIQNPDGLFYHSTDAHFIWGRGDGWMAAGMPTILKYLPKDNEYYDVIMEGYRKMMSALLGYQHESGLWGQLVDDPESWDESSCSAMFAYGFLEGVKNGWLDAKTYGPAARKAWIALCGRLDDHANLSEVCVGTGRFNDHDYYINRPRYNGDSHGQAPMMWICRLLCEK